jgi:hypothetical protein
MSLATRIFGSKAQKATVTDSYMCSPQLKTTMMSRYPDLKAGELEALTWLTTHTIREATEAIAGFLGGAAAFVEKVRTVDPAAADYLEHGLSAGS